MPRSYRLGKRAQKQDQTRERIIRAAIELHASGPATLGAVAARARVSRATLYRHFPDESTLIVACTETVFAERPLPDPTGWEAIADPEERLRTGLRELYQYYADMEPLLSTAETNMANYPALREAMAPVGVRLDQMTDVLVMPWLDGSGSRTLTAAVSHALTFSTWRSLAREQGLTRPEAVELMISLVAATARDISIQLPNEDVRAGRQLVRRTN
jgi:AcrR family transcriptional regulator